MMGVPSAANVTDAELATIAVTVSSPPACRVPCVGGRNENNSNTGTITQDHVIDEAERLVASRRSRTCGIISPRLYDDSLDKRYFWRMLSKKNRKISPMPRLRGLTSRRQQAHSLWENTKMGIVAVKSRAVALARRLPVFEKILNWDRQAVLSRSYFVLALGFGTLIALIAILGIGAIRRVRAIYTEMESTQDAYLQAESFRRDIATDMYLADILVRDYLLDPSPQNAPLHRQQLLEIRSSLQTRLDQLAGSASNTDSPRLEQLQTVVQGYWDSLDPIFDWTAQEKADKSWYFLRHKILPRRQAVVDLAREMAKLNRENLERERERTRHSRRVLESFLYRMISFALSFGCLVALLSTYRVAALEKKQEEQRKQIEETQSNLRKLSRRLVQAQEGERKALSRELHDEVGQTMTALGIEISNLEKLRHSDPEAFHNRIEDAKQLNVKAMQVIRDLAMGLRPSMLDDLGLEPALRWQGREFSRRTGVPASVQVTGLVDELSDAQRTSIYRIVQEALTNCARHAKARNVLVSVCAEGTHVILVVQDDGVGFDATARSRSGLGLLGIQERVQDLEGSLRISSEKNKGTTLRVEIPIGVRA